MKRIIRIGKWLAVLISLLASTTVVMASSLTIDLESCASLADNRSRLRCFDELFLRNNLMPSSFISQPQGEGRWSVYSQKQVLSGARSGHLMLASESLEPGSTIMDNGRFLNVPLLHVECDGKNRSLFIRWRRDLGHNEIALDLSFDGLPPDRQIWRVTLDGNIVRPQGSYDELITKLSLHESLVVSIPRNGLEERFRLSGFRNTAAQLDGVCEWPW